MNDQQFTQQNLVDTTDCLEAVGVFRFYKNIFFVLTILMLLATQAAFWLYQTGNIATGQETNASVTIEPDTQSQPAVAVIEPAASENIAAAEPNQAITAQPQPAAPAESDQIESAAQQIVSADANEPIQLEAKSKRLNINLKVNKTQLEWALKVINFILFSSSMLYCLILLFILKTSLLGRLGGINHAARAFFLSLIALVFIMPWQLCFPGIFPGVLYTHAELVARCAAVDSDTLSSLANLYLRFCGPTIIAFLMIIKAQSRSCRWARTMLRRLEIM